MARTRLLKPDFFADEDLAELPFEARLLFAGLWTIADRAGRLEDRPKRIKAQVFPYDAVNVDSLLTRLDAGQFVARYTVDGVAVIQIRTFCKHQNPHHREPESVLPKNPNKIEKPGLGRGNAPTVQGSASTLPQPGPAVFDTVFDTVPDPVPVPVVVPPTSFDVFWTAYPRKVGKDAAKKAWTQKKPPLQTVLDALAWQSVSDAWTKDGGSYIPHPATYLRQGRWQDERPLTGRWFAPSSDAPVFVFVDPCPHDPPCEDGRARCRTRQEIAWAKAHPEAL